MPAPIQVGKRWVVERSQSWMNGYSKIRRRFERDGRVVGFYLAAAFVTVRALIREARTRCRWDTRSLGDDPEQAPEPMLSARAALILTVGSALAGLGPRACEAEPGGQLGAESRSRWS